MTEEFHCTECGQQARKRTGQEKKDAEKIQSIRESFIKFRAARGAGSLYLENRAKESLIAHLDDIFK